ncbi:glycosyl transferase group 1 [Leptolyngbya sp. 'hensonii']|uniref:glycosyltransferase family 4 protein n=1 Tax=Leptolyngbya sp. 'hensonii' TaxID=1922337 RepID=UPI00094FC1BA|nr:glycosyltransferase family 4 protein [Leptolyngbya sp. 'hensonii']OLP17554.1 glycosyl transferase group 1 [Leptolyngbya sp. 'hensonii']
MQRTKVSVIVSDLSGGGAVRGFLLGQILKHLEYDVEIVGFLFGQALFALPPDQLPIVSTPGCPYPGFFSAIRQTLPKISGDIIYAAKPKPASFGVALLKRLGSSRPVILDMDDWEMSWYGGDDWKYQSGPKQLYRDVFKPNGALHYPDYPLYIRWMEKLVPRANALTVDTEFLKQRFGGVYLPNGKDTTLFNPEPYHPETVRKHLGLSDHRVLMFPGAPRPHKGVEDLLMALDQLNEPDLRLVIVGGSPYDDYDQQLMRRWKRWLIYLPRSPVEKMPEILAAAHIVVVPQRDTLTARSQFPLKLTDGMAMGKPVLSTRVGDIPSILDNTGYLVDPGSPNQLAEMIRKIFQDFNLAIEQGIRARKRCVELYSIDVMAPILSELLSKL